MKIAELHDKLFGILCIIDDICIAENVRYFVDSGTALGSVREKDFISWDDDMDIKVLAEDYPRFKEAMLKNLPEHMHLVEPQIFAPGFYDFTVRIYDDRWLMRNETEEDIYYGNYQNYVGTDVFIYSKAPNSQLGQKLIRLCTKILYGMGMAHRYQVNDQNYTLMQKIQTKILCCIGKNVSVKWICDQWYKRIVNYEKLNFNRRFTSNYRIKNMRFFPNEWYENTIYGEIRGRKVPLPVGYDQELTALYGDYMNPPADRSIYIQHLDKEDIEEGIMI